MSVIATHGTCCINAFRAVRSGHVRCLAAMNNDQLQERDIYQQTPLHIAAKLGQLGAIDVLMRRVPHTADAISLCGENPSLLAVGEGQSKCIERLLSGNLKTVSMRAMQRDMNGTSILMAAVAREDNDTALWLLRTFGKPLAMLPNSCRMLPLHVAASTVHQELVSEKYSMELDGNIEFIRIATKYDSQMANHRDIFGCTPALYAVQGGYLTCLRYLVEKAKSDINASEGHVADSGSVVALGVLLEAIRRKKRRAVLAIRDSLGNTPLHLAAASVGIEELCKICFHTATSEKKSRANVNFAGNGFALMMRSLNNSLPLIKIGRMAVISDDFWLTILQSLAFKFMLAKGANPVLMNAAGQTAEDISRMKSHIQLARLLRLWKDKRHRQNGRMMITSKGESVLGTLARYSSGYESALSQTLATE
uniref:ANK_REP_REGION domain-containing protein n=1 Tax=Parascaris equorum TaxID=6256 RepID=A0A914S030_PAREQ